MTFSPVVASLPAALDVPTGAAAAPRPVRAAADPIAAAVPAEAGTAARLAPPSRRPTRSSPSASSAT